MSTANLGMGLCPMGSSPFGFGTPGAEDVTAPRIFIKTDGTQGDCALLDTTTGDYVLNAIGDKVGWDSIDQTIYLALHTVLGSAAVQSQGINLPAGVIRDDIASKNRQAVAAALKRLTDAGLIDLVDVITTRVGASGVRLEVRWRRVPGGEIQSTFA